MGTSSSSKCQFKSGQESSSLSEKERQSPRGGDVSANDSIRDKIRNNSEGSLGKGYITKSSTSIETIPNIYITEESTLKGYKTKESTTKGTKATNSFNDHISSSSIPTSSLHKNNNDVASEQVFKNEIQSKDATSEVKLIPKKNATETNVIPERSTSQPTRSRNSQSYMHRRCSSRSSSRDWRRRRLRHNHQHGGRNNSRSRR